MCCCADEYATLAADLVAQLESNVAVRQRQAADKIRDIFFHNTRPQPYQTAIVAAGVMPLLIAMLRAEPCKATMALEGIALQGHSNAIIAAMPSLVDLLRSHWPDVREAAATAMSNLVEGSQQSTDAAIAAGAVPMLVAMLKSDHLKLQEKAANAVGNLAAGSQQSSDAVIAAGALPLLVAMLRSDHGDPYHLREVDYVDRYNVRQVAAKALKHLAKGSQQSKDAVIAAGALPLLVTMLRSDRPNVRDVAVGVLGCVANGSQQSKDAVVAAGALPLLIALSLSQLPTDMIGVQDEAAAAVALLNHGCLPVL